jgi:hypothetical protein
MALCETAFHPVQVVVAGLIILGLAGCVRKSGEAVVLEKEHIAAAENRETPSAEPLNSITSPTVAPASEANDEAETAREIKPGEIVAGGYVMDKDVRGTAKDPRALASEQWLVRVPLISGGRKIDVHADRRQYDRVRPGDHVEITYREESIRARFGAQKSDRTKQVTSPLSSGIKW